MVALRGDSAMFLQAFPKVLEIRAGMTGPFVCEAEVPNSFPVTQVD